MTMSVAQKKKTPYLILDDEQNLLFAPSGRYGAAYYVPDAAYRDRIVKRYEIITALSMLPMFFRAIVSLLFRSNKQHGFIEAAVILGTLAITWIVSAYIVRRLTAGLIVARPEPSFFENCLTLSSSTSTLCLWAWQIGATAWAAFFVWLIGTLHVKDPIGLAILYALIALTPITVGMCAFLLYLKERPRPNCI